MHFLSGSSIRVNAGYSSELAVVFLMSSIVNATD